jgi:hypothetical protein
MPYRFIYVDDTKNEIEKGTINGLQDGGEIEIEFRKPGDWEEQINEITSRLAQSNGIILDLRLNDNPYQDNKFAQYRGSTVAQELRTLAKENKFENDFPIVLISANDNIERSLDQTSLDLFDYCINKNKIGQVDGIAFAELRTKLKWLADGYLTLNKAAKNVESILGLENASFLDSRFIDEFNKLLDKPVHVIAQFLNKQVIHRPSFLIDERYLAARLGIDQRSEHWSDLQKKFLNDYEYNGAFSNYFPRWWMHGVESFWNEKISSEYSMRNLSAKKRVDLIIEKTGLPKLTPVLRQENAKSDAFWTICKGTQVAIDTIDGFVIANQDDLFPWQEKEYVSVNEALRPSNIDRWKSVATLEKNRLQKLKDLYGKAEQRNRK